MKKKQNKTNKSSKSINKKRENLSRNQKIVLGLILVATFIVYTPVLQSDFLNYDDDIYITSNPFIQSYTGQNIKSLFSTYYYNQYSPIAMSIMAFQFKLFGVNIFPLKLISILLHLANTFLVFYFVRILFQKFEYAAITAAFFGLHTLQVESVAWLTASMKIGAYTLFFLGSMIAYLIYLNKKDRKYYLLSIVFFLLSCFSKEQAIALIAVVVLIDYVKNRNLLSRSVLLEKIPYVIISLIFAVVTLSIAGEQQSAAMTQLFSPFDRLIFSSAAFGTYLMHFLLPVNLSPFYTYPIKTAIPASYYLSLLLLVAFAAALYFSYKQNNRIIVFCLLFFIANLFLTLLSQILSVRDVMMADRYVYVPIIGIGLLWAYGLEYLITRRKISRQLVLGALIIFGVFISTLTLARTKIWKNSITIFSDAIEKGEKPGQINPFLALAYVNRGQARKTINDFDGALKDYNKSIEANPDYAIAYLNRANLYFLKKQYSLAIPDYQKALELDPDNPKIYSSRGALYATQNKNDLALADFNKAIELDPDYQDPLKNRIRLYFASNQRDLALAEIEKYLVKFPGDAEIIGYQNNLRGN